MVPLFLPHPTPTRDPAQEQQDSDAVPATLAPGGNECWLTTHARSFPGRPTDREHKSAFYIPVKAGLARSQGTSL